MGRKVPAGEDQVDALQAPPVQVLPEHGIGFIRDEQDLHRRALL